MARDGERLFHWCDVDGRILAACVEYTSSHRWQEAKVGKPGRGQYSPGATYLTFYLNRGYGTLGIVQNQSRK